MDYQYQFGSELHQISLDTSKNRLRAVVSGRTYEVMIIEQQPGRLVIRIDQQIYDIYWAARDNTRWISLHGCTYALEKPSQRLRALNQEATGENQLRAPMPAQVREVLAAAGDQVELGDSLIILEAMKMEIQLSAPGKARVAEVLVEAGESVERDQILVRLEGE